MHLIPPERRLCASSVGWVPLQLTNQQSQFWEGENTVCAATNNTLGVVRSASSLVPHMRQTRRNERKCKEHRANGPKMRHCFPKTRAFDCADVVPCPPVQQRAQPRHLSLRSFWDMEVGLLTFDAASTQSASCNVTLGTSDWGPRCAVVFFLAGTQRSWGEVEVTASGLRGLQRSQWYHIRAHVFTVWPAGQTVVSRCDGRFWGYGQGELRALE